MPADEQQIRKSWEEIETIYEEAAIMRASLQEIARVSIPELNPDGDDQAADTMRLIAVEGLQHVGAEVPVQRVSVGKTYRPEDVTIEPNRWVAYFPCCAFGVDSEHTVSDGTYGVCPNCGAVPAPRAGEQRG